MDPFIGSALIFIFGAVAVISGVVAAAGLVARRRVLPIPTLCAAVSVAVVIGSIMTLPPGYSPGERDRVERLHAQFSPALERYRQTHGDYPPTLAAAGIATPQTEYGPLQYRRELSREGRPAYVISFGDYVQNGFVTWWDSGAQQWYLDR